MALVLAPWLLAVVSGAPARAEEAPRFLPSEDVAIRMVLDVATAWPADIEDLRDIVGVGSPHPWMDRITEWPPAGLFATDGATLRARLVARQGLTADTPAPFGREIQCERLDRAAMDEARMTIDAMASGDASAWGSMSGTNVDVFTVNTYMDAVPADALAAQTCTLVLWVDPGFDAAASPILREAFEHVGPPIPETGSHLLENVMKAELAFVATGWRGGASGTRVDHVFGFDQDPFFPDATTGAMRLDVIVTSWMGPVGS